MHPFLTRQFSSFTYLNITQFLGALNDNIYKLLVVFFLIQQQGIENSHIILSCTGAVFVLPFLLFSSNSGTLADRFSKRNIIVLTKILELLVMAVGVLGFAFESATLSYLALFLLATQSAIFGPSKYGIIPEIVTSEKISSANGLMTSFTFLAIIIGTFLASFLTDITGRNFILACLFCTVISLVGVIISFGIQYTPPAGSEERFNVSVLSQIYQTLKQTVDVPSLLPAVFGSSFFLFLGSFIQLNIIPFAVQSLGLTDVQGGYLFLITALGIGTGSVVAGKISGKTVELGLTPVAAFGIALGLFSLQLFSNDIWMIAPLVIITGFLGGLYQIPLDSYIQIVSPNDMRGQIVAATNFMSFLGVLLSSVLIYVLTAVFSLSAAQGFIVMAILALLIAILYGVLFYDYLIRFLGMLISKLHFSETIHGQDLIPDGPALFIVPHTGWNDTLLLLGMQRRRIRFFIDHPFAFGRLDHLLYKRLPYETLTQESRPAIEEALKKGYSVALLITKAPSLPSLKDLPAPVFHITIDKTIRPLERQTLLDRTLSHLQVPVTLTLQEAPH